MIVHPDFPDHWKTQLLVTEAGPEAVLCLLRFWAHCQQRRSWKFDDLTPEKLAAICKFGGNKNVFFSVMLRTFLEEKGKFIVAHEWKEVNASLISNWNKGKYGKLGGRPKTKTLRVSPRFDPLTLGKPDKRREDKIRESTEPRGVVIPAVLLETIAFEIEWRFFIEHRNKKRAPMTPHAQDLILETLSQRPADSVEALKMAITRNWTGFRWDWFDKENLKHSGELPLKSESKRDREYREFIERKQKEKHG